MVEERCKTRTGVGLLGSCMRLQRNREGSQFPMGKNLCESIGVFYMPGTLLRDLVA